MFNKGSIGRVFKEAPVTTLSILPPLITFVGFAIANLFPDTNMAAQRAIFDSSDVLSWLNLSSLFINTIGIAKPFIFDKNKPRIIDLIKDPKLGLKAFGAIMDAVGLYVSIQMMGAAQNNMMPGPMYPPQIF